MTRQTKTIRARLEIAHDATVLAQAALITLESKDVEATIDPGAIPAAAERAIREARSELFILSSLLPECVQNVAFADDDYESEPIEAALLQALQPKQKKFQRLPKSNGGAR